MFINIDGPNGVGKTTTVNGVARVLESKGYTVKIVHFHRRGTLIGDAIQQVLNGETTLNKESLQMLYAADMLDFTKEELPKLQGSYDVIIADRYYTSSIAIGMAIGIDAEALKTFHSYDAKPDVNFILTASTEEILKRVSMQRNVPGQTGDIFEQKMNHIKIIDSYRNLKNETGGIEEIDVNVSTDIGIKSIVSKITNKLKYSK